MKIPHSTLFRSSVLACSILAAAFSRSDAALIAYEDFSYTAGLSIIGLNGGTGWSPSSAWAGNNPSSGSITRVISSNTITYDLNGFTYGGGNSFEITGTDLSRVADRTVDRSGLTVGQDIYFSYIFQAEGGTGNLNSSAFSSIYARGSAGISTTNGNALITGVSGGRAGARTGSTTSTGTSPVLQYDTTYLIAGRLSGWDGTAYRTTSIWLNPDLNSLGTPTATSTNDASGIGEFFGVVFRINGLESTGTTVYFDDLRIGTTWNAVVIPEPSAIGFLFAAGLAWVIIRRHRRRTA